MIYSPGDIRAWAQEVGEPVAGRGRLSYQVIAAYLKAHPQITRGLAADHGVSVSARGAISWASCEELTRLMR